MSDNLSHLKALNTRLSHERDYLRAAKTSKEKSFREHQINMVTREIEGEISFLKKKGVTVPPDMEPVSSDISDDELLAELGFEPGKKSNIRWT